MNEKMTDKNLAIILYNASKNVFVHELIELFLEQVEFMWSSEYEEIGENEENEENDDRDDLVITKIKSIIKQDQTNFNISLNTEKSLEYWRGFVAELGINLNISMKEVVLHLRRKIYPIITMSNPIVQGKNEEDYFLRKSLLRTLLENTLNAYLDSQLLEAQKISKSIKVGKAKANKMKNTSMEVATENTENMDTKNTANSESIHFDKMMTENLESTHISDVDDFSPNKTTANKLNKVNEESKANKANKANKVNKTNKANKLHRSNANIFWDDENYNSDVELQVTPEWQHLLE